MIEDHNAYLHEEKPYPLETLRHWYVTPFGGRSRDLSQGQVGINSRALDQNTSLIPNQDKVLISILGRGAPRPLYARTPFQVIALDSSTPSGLQKSPQGEAVLPLEETWDVIRRPYLQPKRGQALLLNGVASKISGRDPMELLAEALSQRFNRPSGGF